MLELLLQLFGELALQLFAELTVELGIRSLSSSFKKSSHPIYSTIGYFLWGSIIGGISLLIMPTSFITNPYLRWLNLILTPTIIGIAMMSLGKLREKKGQALINLDRFGYAFIFAFALALVRIIWAK